MMPIRNFVFKGGGIKGIAYVGVLAALEAVQFDFDEVKRIGGTSAGAIIALAFALRLTSQELKEVLNDIQFDLMLDNDLWRERVHAAQQHTNSSSFYAGSYASTSGASHLSSAASRLSEKLGLFPGEMLRELFEKILCWKTGIRHCTFQELHDAGFKDLYVVGFNLSTQLAETFCVDKTPTIIVSDAIRISMSIPFVFEPHSIFSKIEGQRIKDESGDTWTDGGIAENYPIRLFDHIPTTAAVSLVSDELQLETLGFYLAKGERRDYLAGIRSTPPRNTISGLQQYTSAIMSALQDNDYNEQVRYEDRCRTIIIDTGNVGTLDFHLSHEHKNNLMLAGWNSVCRHYSRNELLDQLPVELHTQPPIIIPSEHSRSTLLALAEENIIIDPSTWSVAIAYQESIPDNIFILIEGKNEFNQTWISRYDYRGGRVVVRESEDGLSEKQAPRQLASLLETRITYSQCWKIKRESAQELQQKIRTYPQSSSITSSAAWCQSMLRSVNAFHISGNLPHDMDIVIVLGQKTPFTIRLYAKVAPQSNEKPVKTSWW